MSYRTWYDPPRKGDEEPFPGSSDDMMNTIAALRAQVAKLEGALLVDGVKLLARNAELEGLLREAEHCFLGQELRARVEAAMSERLAPWTIAEGLEKYAGTDELLALRARVAKLEAALTKIRDNDPDSWEASIARAALEDGGPR